METLKNLIINKMWDNLDFWHILFISVILCLLLIKIFHFIDKTMGIFKNYKQHDLALFKKFQAFFSDDEMKTFLNDLQRESKYNKKTLTTVGDLEALMSATANKYDSDILKHHVQKIMRSLNALKYFLIINFSEDMYDEKNAGSGYLYLLPDHKKDFLDKKKKEIYGQDDKASELLEEKQNFYYKKERELKELVNHTAKEYETYREVIKKYLNA